LKEKRTRDAEEAADIGDGGLNVAEKKVKGDSGSRGKEPEAHKKGLLADDPYRRRKWKERGGKEYGKDSTRTMRDDQREKTVFPSGSR